MVLFFLTLIEARAESKKGFAAERLSVCYNASIPPEQFEPFNLVVLDSSYPSKNIRQLRMEGKTVFGYLSLGAVGKNRWWYQSLHEAGALQGQNPGFDSLIIDLDNPLWIKLIEQRIIPAMLERGFNAIFLDDLDLIYQTQQHHEALELISRIRLKFPKLKIMGNRGLEYLTGFAKEIDYVLLESCVAEGYKLTEKADLQWALEHLAAGKKANRRLIACALDYYAKTPTAITPQSQKLIDAIRRIHARKKLVSCISVESLGIVPLKQ